MGYSIDNDFAWERREGIIRLNEIIDNKRLNDLELSGKLHIMEIYEELFKEEMEDFNYDVVISFMKSVGWKWRLKEKGLVFPDRKDIYDYIKDYFLTDGLYNIIQLGKKRYTASGGGVVFEMGLSGDYPSKEVCYLNVYFDISHFVGD